MEPGKTYHLYTHANGSENIFRNDENFRYFLKRYCEFIPNIAYTLAYCLMPNHLHLLVRMKDEKELIEYFKIKYPTQNLTGLEDLSGLERLTILQFSHLLNAYSKAYNKMYQRRGSLFTRAFKRKEITDDSYFTQVIRYLHTNPVHHGFVKNTADWRWSSYNDIMNGKSSIVKPDEIISWFGNKEQFFIFHQNPVELRGQNDFET